MRTLRELAHSRTGDKGDTSNISLIAYDAADYPLLVRWVTAARVKAHFAGLVKGDVVRYELPKLGALNFVLEHALSKSLSSALLSMAIPNRVEETAND